MAKTKKKKQNRKEFPDLLTVLFVLAPFCLGVFYEALSALLALLLLIRLAVSFRKNGMLTIRFSLPLLAAAVIAGGFLISTFWAVDRGMAPLGFVKFLPFPLFLLCFAQPDAPSGERLLRTVPGSAAVMTVVSFLLGQIPSLYDIVFEGRRLAGFFQYSNSFALFLLLGVLILLQAEKTWKMREILCLLILFAGIAFSGSRTTMLLLGAAVLGNLVLQKKDRLRRFLPAGALALTVLLGVLGDPESVGRFLRLFGDGAGTLTTRLLFWHDALPLILTHPFGLGYLGWHFLQGSVQTGVYSTMFVHNEYLQILLDVGWLPFLLTVAAAVRCLIRSGWKRRILLAFFLLHCAMDFDLQFMALGLILLAIPEPEGREFKIGKFAAVVCCLLLTACCLYFGTAAALQRLGVHRAAVTLYPGETLSQIEILKEEDTPDGMGARADAILRSNRTVSLAWSAKARTAAAHGDLDGMMFAKREAIRLARFDRAEYLDYIDLLAEAQEAWTARGDTAKAAQCDSEMRAVLSSMEEAEASLSGLGRSVPQQPDMSLPPEYAWLEAYR